MFATLGRSWEFTKISYGILWDFKQLVVFPIISGTAALLVLASFLLPLWGTGTLEHWMQVFESDGATATTGDRAVMWTVLFAYYFVSYFVIVFFNSGLTACALKVVSGEQPTIGYGMSMAARRLPQIAAWAFISALVGVLLRALERYEKIGELVAAVLGCAWSALTYFVVPVLVVDGVGPIMAIKLSVGTLKSTWGEALVGHFSLGLLAFLVLLPVMLVCGVLVALAFMAGNTVGIVLTLVAATILIIVACAATSAADIVFKALLYNYATGRTIATDVDTGSFQEAFASKGK